MAEQTNGEARPETRVVLLPAPGLNTVYANTFHTQSGGGEFFLTACVSQAGSDGEGPLVSVQPQARLAMTIGSARQLAGVLLEALQRHEQAGRPDE